MNAPKIVSRSWWQVKGLHDLFEIGVVLKGVNAAFELVFGFTFLFVNVGAVIRALVANEIIEDPNNFLASRLNRFAGNLSHGVEVYTALYLIAHGIVKAFLVWGLLRKKVWAYPASLAVLALFILYQTITFFRSHSTPLLLLTFFDLALVYLIWHEYRHMKKKWGI